MATGARTGRKKAPRPKATTANPNKPKVFMMRCGTRNQLGPTRTFASEAEMKKAARNFYAEYISWAQMFEKAAVDRIQATLDAINGMTSLTVGDAPRTFECLIDSYRDVWGVVTIWKVAAPDRGPVQTTIPGAP